MLGVNRAVDGPRANHGGLGLLEERSVMGLSQPEWLERKDEQMYNDSHLGCS